MQFLTKKNIYFLLTLAIGILFFYFQRDYQPFLSQGDHGRDLYVFKKVYEGGIIYRDFWYQNGPLMPYYYSLVYHVFGVSIQSTLLGFYFLVFLSGLVIFSIASLVLKVEYAFICPIWYWAFRGGEFFYTYNHAGAILLMLLSVYWLCRYVLDRDDHAVLSGLACVFFLLLVRPNIGASTLAVCWVFWILADYFHVKKIDARKFVSRSVASGFILLGAAMIYGWLIAAVPSGSFQRGPGYVHAFVTAQPLENILQSFQFVLRLAWAGSRATRLQAILSILTALACLSLLISFLKNKRVLSLKDPTMIACAAIVTLMIFNLHELLVRRIWFRADWAICLVPIVSCFFLDRSTRALPEAIRKIVYGIVVACSFLGLASVSASVQLARKPEHLFSVNNNRIYISPEQIGWARTVTETTRFLTEHVPRGAKIIAMPYDPLYYFLSGHDSAVRQLVFFDINDLNQENEIVRGINSANVDFILLSNRANHSMHPLESSRGAFGREYGKILGQYLRTNFAEIARFGPWEASASWIDNHAVTIYKRIQN